MATRSITFRNIISFSAEHPQNKVENLLKTSKWTCPKHHPETTIYVELGLPPCYIKSLDVGNHWTAVLEIEVGSNKTNSKRESLLKAPSTLMSRNDCQIGSNKDAMKFYMADDDFTSSAKNRLVERIRFICSQPLRRDVLFGLSTVAVRGISVDDLDAQASSPCHISSDSPSYSGNFDFESTHKSVVGLTGLASKHKSIASAETQGNNGSSWRDMSEAEIQAGVENLQSKLNKQKEHTPVPPKDKYASLFLSAGAPNKGKSSTAINPLKGRAQQQSQAQTRKRKVVQEDNARNTPVGVKQKDINFRKSVIEFMRNIDPGNEFGYKELTSLWVAEKGHPQIIEERTVLEEVAINHSQGKPLKRESTPTASTPISSSSHQTNKFMFKKKADIASVKEAAETATAENTSSTYDILHGGTNENCKGIQNDHLQDIQVIKSNVAGDNTATCDTVRYNTFDERGGKADSSKDILSSRVNFKVKQDYLLYNDDAIRKMGILVEVKRYKKDKVLPLADGGEVKVDKGTYVTFFKNAHQIHMKINGKILIPAVEPDHIADIFKYNTEKENADLDRTKSCAGSSQEIFSSGVNFKAPNDYLKYNDDELREMGILVQVKRYKKDKFLPLIDGGETKVDKGTFVTFFKNAHQIHMKINGKIHTPDVEPDHFAGIFKDYTEKEIADSDRTKSSAGLETGGPQNVANLSDCPICSKKVTSKDLEIHTRLCAESMFG